MNLTVTQQTGIPFVSMAFATVAATLVLLFSGAAMAETNRGPGCLDSTECNTGFTCQPSGRCVSDGTRDRDRVSQAACAQPESTAATPRAVRTDTADRASATAITPHRDATARPIVP